uniref:Apple domain-containing protein n=1 Tax=Romanomermis culicivorax TaxID=13658 RepID=A0A915ILK0_ROMCU
MSTCFGYIPYFDENAVSLEKDCDYETNDTRMDFRFGTEIFRVSLLEPKACAMLCYLVPECTHFVSAYGFCTMKHSDFKNEVLNAKQRCLDCNCGRIDERFDDDE